MNSVGLHTWESVYIVRKGANYGYPLREANETLKNDNTTATLPVPYRVLRKIRRRELNRSRFGDGAGRDAGGHRYGLSAATEGVNELDSTKTTPSLWERAG